jgi:hypothetical protein
VERSLAAWRSHSAASPAADPAAWHHRAMARHVVIGNSACSLAAHRVLHDGFAGDKRELTSREAIEAHAG